VTWPKWRLLRDILLFTLGAGGVLALLANWLVTGTAPDQILALIFTSMLGLPLALHKDEDGGK
jgi:hypothetical protein